MEWLAQNWIWIILALGLVLLMRRGGLGGCGMGHAHQRRGFGTRDQPARSTDTPDRGDRDHVERRHGC